MTHSDDNGKLSLSLSRRSFIKRAGLAAAAPWIIPAAALGRDGAVAPSERITVALVGHGVMGRGHWTRLLGDPACQALAICDVDRLRREDGRQQAEEAYAAQRASGTWRGCEMIEDYRALLDRPDLDAVVIATPDHAHTPISIHFAQAGKDVYCEKPISLTIGEGRRLAEVMRRTGRIFQTGTQYRSIPVLRRVLSFIRAGGLGRVKSVFTMWNNLESCLRSARFKPWLDDAAVAYYGKSCAPVALPLRGEPVPEALNWPLWVGTAPWREFNAIYHPTPSIGVVPWCFCEDFGGAAVTWHHSHSADVIQWALGFEESGPVEIVHPASGEFPTLTCRYADGVLVHHVENLNQVKELYHALPPETPLEGAFGGLFIGERGWLSAFGSCQQLRGAPESLFEEMGLRTREVVIGSNNHHQNWLECIRTRQRPYTDEELGHRSASLGHLINISFKLGRSLKWDPAQEVFNGDEEANRMRARVMREPWMV